MDHDVERRYKIVRHRLMVGILVDSSMSIASEYINFLFKAQTPGFLVLFLDHADACARCCVIGLKHKDVYYYHARLLELCHVWIPCIDCSSFAFRHGEPDKPTV